jgi:hypothetical protein
VARLDTRITYLLAACLWLCLVGSAEAALERPLARDRSVGANAGERQGGKELRQEGAASRSAAAV